MLRFGKLSIQSRAKFAIITILKLKLTNKLKIDNEIIADEQIIANKFNDYFISVPFQLASNIGQNNFELIW